MKVILFGASGMVGQGVLRECLLDPGVERVVSVGRSPSGKTDAKLEELVHKDLFDLSPVADRLAGFDACFFCLGVSSAGMTEAEYTKVTYDLTLSVAKQLLPINPAMTFIYVSGSGTKSNEQGAMWARVKGRTENELLKLGFERAIMFRPGIIQPKNGIVSRTFLYRLGYVIGAPIIWLLKVVAPGLVTDNEKVGRAMLVAARSGAPQTHLENRDINALAAT